MYRRITALLFTFTIAGAGPLGCGDDSGVGSRFTGNGDNNGNPDAGGQDTESDGLGVGPGGNDTGGGNTGDTGGGGNEDQGGGEDDAEEDTSTGEEPERLLDTDGDWISDFHEGLCATDTDADTVPDCRDLDSDADGIPDSVEGGDADLETAPFDSDEDNTPDFRDFDSDNDGILDTIEGTADPDNDDRGNWIDLDSDGDTLGDLIEGQDDEDNDLVPNYLDTDSDNDTIADWVEGFEDSDDDGIPDRFDQDSDNDGVFDNLEAGDGDLETVPIDTDDDDLPNFLDLDSDGDGLTDTAEIGCPSTSDRLLVDSDNDGFSDLSETAVGSNACSNGEDVFDFVEFFFILPWEGEGETDELEFSTDLRQVDVAFNMDTTASMSGEIDALQDSITGTIIPDVADALDGANVAFGVSEFRDVPIDPFGNSGDLPFRLRQRITTNAGAAENGADALSHGGGNDIPESGWESLYQVAAGTGGISWAGGSVPAFNAAANRIAGVADGTIGGVGFRAGSFPIVVHITDAVSHNSGDYSGTATGAHSRSQAVGALTDISARVIGVASGSNVRTELRALARDTFAEVPVCAFNGACGANQCCTGISGAAETPVDGMCPLVFSINADGTGLSGVVVDAIEFLGTNSTIEVTTRVIRDNAEFAATGIDTSCFIKSVIPNRAENSDSCAVDPQMADLYAPFGVDDSFRDVTPGTQVFFDVFAENDTCAEHTEEAQVFQATIEVLGDGVTVLDSLEVTVIVPPADLSGPK